MRAEFLLFLLTLIQIKYLVCDPVIRLPSGPILGREATTSEENTYYAFEKIPFAAPPIGDLRFKDPQPVENWNDVLNTTQLDVACFQSGRHTVPESEDCLYLNVYTPKVSEEAESLPVMAYIHGGGFATGRSFGYQPDLFIDSGVILVTISYRLGVFGFLSTEDDVVPGNNGLKDQLQALVWIHDNVRFFGGDKDKVTIFGQSTGAASCGYHLLNQNSAGLFSGAILESGSFLTQVALQRNAKSTAFGIATTLNSTFDVNSDTRTLVQFLQGTDAMQLNTAAEQYTANFRHTWDSIAVQGAIWAPVLEVKNPTAFITRKMYGLLQAGRILPVPTMMGFTSEECIGNVGDLETLKGVLATIDENLSYLVPDDMRIFDQNNRTEMGVQIRKIYTGGEPLVTDLASGVRYCSDNRIRRPMIKHAELFSAIAPTYFYQFSYDGVLGGGDYSYEDLGSVGHSEELKYLFCGGADCNNNTYPRTDLLTRQRLIKLWTYFAKYRNPTPEACDLLQNVRWPQLSVDTGDFIYLDIDGNLTIKDYPRKRNYIAWTDLYDSLDYDDFDTY